MISSRPLLALAAAALLGCSPVTNGTYQGEPLATVRGQLTSATNVTGPIRLALGWYANLDPKSPAAPKAIITEEVQYQGTFPLNYTFHIYAPPPSNALTLPPTKNPSTTKVAVGILIAYQDDNGNGTLDTIPPGGKPIDTVLGTSVGKILQLGASESYSILYADSTPPSDPDWPAGTQAGFNVIKAAGPGQPPALPITTAVPIEIDPHPFQNVWVCEELFSGASYDGGTSLPCGIGPLVFTPDAGAAAARVAAIGNLAVYEFGSGVGLTVMSGGVVVSDATVKVNQRAIPYDAQAGLHVLFDSSTTNPLVKVGASNEIDVQRAGSSPLLVNLAVPAAFQITAPPAGAQVKQGSALNVSWIASTGANDYSVSVTSSQGASLYQGNSSGTSLTTDPINHVGQATVSVVARTSPVMPNGSYLSSDVTRSRSLELVP